MLAVEALTQRVSCASLAAPAPSEDQLKVIQQAALRTADHAYLRPWRFLMLENESLEQLGDIFAQARQLEGADDTAIEKARKMPLRAPLIIVVIASFKDHPKVPLWEQLVSAGGAAQNMVTAAYAQGVGAIWRTGDLAMNDHVNASLRLSKKEKIVGFLYLGTRAKPTKPVPELNIDEFFTKGLPAD